LMRMFEPIELAFNWYVTSIDEYDDGRMYVEFEEIVNANLLLKTKNLLKSMCFCHYEKNNHRGIYTGFDIYGSCLDSVRIGVIKVYYKSIDISEFERESKAIDDTRGDENHRLTTDFFKKHIDFEKTITKKRNEGKMWGENIYLDGPSTSEYDESTFEELLKALNIYERKPKLTELFTE